MSSAAAVAKTAGAALTGGLGPALITGASSLLGGLIGSKGQEAANAQNVALAREQMAFQERMSNTAYQRAATDLEKAGLNRILALGKPASSPGGQTATMQNVGAAGVNAAAQTAQAVNTARQTAASVDLVKAQTRKTNNEANITQIKGDIYEWARNFDWQNLASKVGTSLAKEIQQAIKTLPSLNPYDSPQWAGLIDVVEQTVNTAGSSARSLQNQVEDLRQKLRNITRNISNFSIRDYANEINEGRN